MKTVINISLPRGFLGGRPAVATTRTADEQKRDPDGKFGSGGGGGHVQKHVPREDGSRAERADIARASVSHKNKRERFTKTDHKNTAASHEQQAAKHEALHKKSPEAGHEAAAKAHRFAAASHKRAASAKEEPGHRSREALSDSLRANQLSDKVYHGKKT